MKNLFRTIALTLCLCFIFQSEAVAQDYKSAVGLRLGYPWAASYKTFISESNAIEVYASYRGFTGWSWIGLNGAYQIHNDLGSTEGLQWYYGGGAGIQFWSAGDVDLSGTFFNISGYLGLQYTFADTPISLTADWVPTFFIGDGFGGFGGFGGGYGNLGVRYVLSGNGKK
ncbi:hypothetical protein QWY85_01125 [Neolewinella lacunae]|uniref:Uncharacterized protein n=1 Tax=Neolewinella lacunae TaxID=1517758 RepID=A0A923TDM1_9BACT|nr:hypothetical protein [Neolewinella lacunae]MBC6994992.1 hypothetical protein [Neolewinella lacunae]MDN3633237.1 hypothetical protein [Neolewinella lacunae]